MVVRLRAMRSSTVPWSRTPQEEPEVDWSQRRAVMREMSALPLRVRGRLIRDYRAGRPVAPEHLALLHRWAPAYPPYGWFQISVTLLACAWPVRVISTDPVTKLPWYLVLTWFAVMTYQTVRNLRAAARLRREAAPADTTSA